MQRIGLCSHLVWPISEMLMRYSILPFTHPLLTFPQKKLLSVDDYFTRSDVFDLYDVFEPTLICDALTSKKLNLGHLIFGFQQWKEFNPDWKFQPLSDPLTAMFLKRGQCILVRFQNFKLSNACFCWIGLLSETSRTFLHCDSYKKLFDTGDPNKRPWRQSMVAWGSNVSSRQTWSVTSLFLSYLVTNVDDDILDQKWEPFILSNSIFWWSVLQLSPAYRNYWI